MSAAAKAGALISVPFRPGQFVLQGETLASISPASKLASLAPLVSRSVTMGRHRVLSQDLEFGVAQIVEIAIRALSPAINDTFTGIASVDLLGEALTILAAAPQCSGRWFDTDGKLRLQVRPLLLPRLVKQAFDQIRQAAADNPAVLIRLLSTIGRLAPKLQAAQDRSALVEQAAAVWETANTRPLVKMDREDIEAAWQKTRAELASFEVLKQSALTLHLRRSQRIRLRSANNSWMGGKPEVIVPFLGLCQIADARIEVLRSLFRRVTGYTEITRLVARHKMFFGSSKRVRCGLPTYAHDRASLAFTQISVRTWDRWMLRGAQVPRQPAGPAAA